MRFGSSNVAVTAVQTACQLTQQVERKRCEQQACES